MSSSTLYFSPENGFKKVYAENPMSNLMAYDRCTMKNIEEQKKKRSGCSSVEKKVTHQSDFFASQGKKCYMPLPQHASLVALFPRFNLAALRKK